MSKIIQRGLDAIDALVKLIGAASLPAPKLIPIKVAAGKVAAGKGADGKPRR